MSEVLEPGIHAARQVTGKGSGATAQGRRAFRPRHRPGLGQPRVYPAKKPHHTSRLVAEKRWRAPRHAHAAVVQARCGRQHLVYWYGCIATTRGSPPRLLTEASNSIAGERALFGQIFGVT